MQTQTVRFHDGSFMARGAANHGAMCTNHPKLAGLPGPAATHTWFSPKGLRWNTYCEPCALEIIRATRFSSSIQ